MTHKQTAVKQYPPPKKVANVIKYSEQNNVVDKEGMTKSITAVCPRQWSAG